MESSMTPQCRTLCILEILRVVLDNLNDDKRSIVSLAYSSKAVSDTALDYLWADMDSLAPFVPLLPRPIQKICYQQSNIVNLPVALKCPPLREWKHFDKYAYRVRHIRSRRDPFCGFPYQMVASIRTGCDLFPRLSSLQCYLVLPVIPSMKIFPSSLRSLSVYSMCTLDGRTELALCQASHDAPYLEELYITSIYHRHPETGLHPLDFKRLHTVHLIGDIFSSFDLESFLRLLSTSPILNLGFSLESDVAIQVDGPSVPPDAFPYLENIFICNCPRKATDIISRICSPYLKSVTIERLPRDPLASVSEYGDFFTFLAQRHPPIHSLEVKTGRIYFATQNEYVRGFLVALEPLVYAGLEDLRVEMSAWEVEEDIKKRLRPEAWPSLTHFEFVLKEGPMEGELPSD